MTRSDQLATGQQSPGTWLFNQRWLIARRTSQTGILALFLLGPLAGLWIIKGNLSASRTLDVIPLTDPYVFMQSLFAGHIPGENAIIGAVIVALFYILVGGRSYCAWVCPVNIVTDTAAWLRSRLGIRAVSVSPGRNLRYWILAMTFVVATITGVLAWEFVNPVSMLHRGIVFGMGMAWSIVLAVFLLDLLLSKRAWCGHLCPMGAFYSLLGTMSVVRISASNRVQCNDCMDCFEVCPEPQVITPPLRGESKGISPVIFSSNCTNCGRCIDVCSESVFKFGTRFHQSNSKNYTKHTEVVL